MGHSEAPVCGDDGARAGDEALGARRRRLPIMRECQLLGFRLAMALLLLLMSARLTSDALARVLPF
jgi:hypothetical protein